MKPATRKRPGYFLLMCCFTFLVLFHEPFAHDIGSAGVTDRGGSPLGNSGSGTLMEDHMASPASIAESLLRDYDLVADGVFLIPVATPNELRALKPKDVVIRFRFRKRYKGEASESVKIRLNSNMLEFPGEGISRHIKREQILDKQREYLKPFQEELDSLQASLETGAIDRAQYEAERDRLRQLIRDRKKKDGLAGGREFYIVFHGQTFFDRQGAIRADQRYLIGVNKVQDRSRTYKLDAVYSGSTIYWGEMRDNVLSALETLNANPAP